ncbi:hypothetical protein ACF0H5_023419 [Mactra antiquata]
MEQQAAPAGGEWKNHLCGCFNNFQICMTAFILPFVTFGTTAENVGEGHCILCAAAYFVPGLNCYEWLKIRGKIREMKGIEGSTGMDCLTIMFLPFCALVQEAQEVDPLSAPSAMSMGRN